MNGRRESQSILMSMALILSAATLLFSPAASAQCQYEVTGEIRANPCPPFGTRPPVFANAMNRHGHVVGYWTDCDDLHEHGFVWKPETGVVELPLPPGVTGIVPEDINDAGVICGTWAHTGEGYRGFVRWADGSYTELDTLSGGGWGMAHAINNNNVVVGERATGPSTTPRVAFVWSQADGFVDIGFPQFPSSFASDISDTDVVVGAIYGTDNVFSWSSGQLTLYGNVLGSDYIESVAIGRFEKLPIIGTANIAGPHPFAWDSGFMYLSYLPKHNQGAATAVRDHPRQIVGFSRRFQSSPHVNELRGVIWLGESIYDLNNLTTGSPAIITAAVDITINGAILATGGGRGFVLQPINASASDLDGDCRVNGSDIVFLFDHWNQIESPADINDSGRVDVFDLFILLSDWTG